MPIFDGPESGDVVAFNAGLDAITRPISDSSECRM